MAQQIVQILFGFTGTAAAYAEQFLPAAPQLAGFPGLVWKVWLMDEANAEAGGIYLFDDEPAARAFLSSPPVEMLRSDPAYRNLSIKCFGILAEHSAITRAPVRVAQSA